MINEAILPFTQRKRDKSGAWTSPEFGEKCSQFYSSDHFDDFRSLKDIYIVGPYRHLWSISQCTADRISKVNVSTKLLWTKRKRSSPLFLPLSLRMRQQLLAAEKLSY